MASTTTEFNLASAQASKLDVDSQEFLTFALGGEEYGIPILNVQEIIGYVKPTPIPNAPGWVSGVINIRGVVIPVVDVRALFAMSSKEYDTTSVIIVTSVGTRVIGAVVDQVNDVLAFQEDQMQATPQVSSGVRTDYITGLGKLDDRLVMLLDMQEVMSGQNLEALAKSAASAHHQAIRGLAEAGIGGAEAGKGAKSKTKAKSKTESEVVAESPVETVETATAEGDAPEAPSVEGDESVDF
ncbi:MAG: chemotaxis protein CheW [Nitrospirota bacterium]|nr:chemotaxis protein CheW [Nitrospirota bacterium]